MFIRVEARDALKEAIESVAQGVQVTKGFDGPDAADEEIYLGPTVGNVTYDVFAAQAMPRDDEFVVDVLVRAAKHGQDQDVAEERTQELMNAVDQALKDPTFDDLEVDCDGGRAWVFDALIADADGPHTEPFEGGFRGFGSVSVVVHTRSVYAL